MECVIDHLVNQRISIHITLAEQFEARDSGRLDTNLECSLQQFVLPFVSIGPNAQSFDLFVVISEFCGLPIGLSSLDRIWVNGRVGQDMGQKRKVVHWPDEQFQTAELHSMIRSGTILLFAFTEPDAAFSPFFTITWLLRKLADSVKLSPDQVFVKQFLQSLSVLADSTQFIQISDFDYIALLINISVSSASS